MLENILEYKNFSGGIDYVETDRNEKILLESSTVRNLLKVETLKSSKEFISGTVTNELASPDVVHSFIVKRKVGNKFPYEQSIPVI
jgi:hypothetical protein